MRNLWFAHDIHLVDTSEDAYFHEPITYSRNSPISLAILSLSPIIDGVSPSTSFPKARRYCHHNVSTYLVNARLPEEKYEG